MRKERLELSRVSPLDSKSSASASSATFARAVRTGRAGYGHTCRPCVGVARIIADGNLPPALQRLAIAAALLLQLIDYSVEEGLPGSSAPPRVPGPVIAL